MAQFEEATAAMDAAKAEVREANPDDDRKAKIHFKQATEELFAKMSTEALSGIVREDWESAPFLQRKFAFMRPKLNSPQLLETRDKILGLARTPMDRSVLHERILMSVYRVITREETLPPRFGPRWETVGFQGDDPATDLRGSGMLSLIQALHMAAKRPKLSADGLAPMRLTLLQHKHHQAPMATKTPRTNPLRPSETLQPDQGQRQLVQDKA